MTNPPFGFDEPEHSPGYLLWQTTVSWQRIIKKALEPFDVTHAQFVIMACLLWWQGKQRELNQIDLVKMSKLDKMTVSKSLRKLVNMGLVIRQESVEDTRAKNVSLTKAGSLLAKKLVPVVEGIDKVFFGQLKNKEQENLIVALQKLAEE